ncbi:MAG TPA: YerC/YecD family TrpR-related protein [Candidatus Paceibacterota bacterium]
MTPHITNEDKNWIWPKVQNSGVWEAFLALKNEEELRMFFRDLMTEKELQEFDMRWGIAKMLDSGMTFAQIEAKTGISPITITRINKWLKEGTGGYKMMIDRLKK